MDLYFIHCPSYYDFRKDYLISGSGAAGIPTSSIFEMYPVGLISMADMLQKYNYKVKIINLALKMLKRKKFEVQKYLKNLEAEAFAFDLHWMIHAQGSLKIANIIKKFHPHSKIIFGGFTASYFYKELIRDFPFIDFIIRGDSAELPLLQLMNNLSFGNGYENIPNLVWREEKRIKANKITHVPEKIEYNGLNFPKIYFKMFLDSLDLDPFSYLPTLYFLKKPVIPILFSKGCTYNCINCGGSRFASKFINNRTCLAKKSPKLVAEEILNISQSFDFPLRIIGDWRICGKRYYHSIFNYLGSYEIDNPTTFEFFTPATKNYLKLISKNFNKVSIEISPESGNQEVRMFQGRPFTNRGIFDMIKNFDQLNEYLFIMWFQVGNALDSKETLDQTVDFCEKSLKMSSNIYPFISPLAPYIDPGSLAFEFPERYGYSVIHKNLKEQITGFSKPTWNYYINYKTKNITPRENIHLSYEYIKKLENIKFQNGILNKEFYFHSIKLLEFLENLTNKADEIYRKEGRKMVNNFLKRMKFDKTGLNVKRELTPVLFPQINFFDFAKNFIKFSSYSLKKGFTNIL